MIFETHAHYDDEAFDQDRDELIASMPDNGIECIVNVGANMDTSRKSIELAAKYSYVYAAVGVHPSETGRLTETDMQWLLNEAKTNPKVLAIGEIGLDYYWTEDNPEDKDGQKKWFRRQIELAREAKKPIMIHSRDAAQDTYDIMKEMKTDEIGGIVHCFSYSKEMAKQFLDLGFYLGIGGVVTFKNARVVKETVEMAPIERIVLETDSPYLSPEPNRGKRNSSLNIPYVAKKIAELKNMEYQDVIDITTQNAKRLLSLS